MLQRTEERDVLRFDQRFHAVLLLSGDLAADRDLRGAIGRRRQLKRGTGHQLARVERTDLQRDHRAVNADLPAAFAQAALQRFLHGKRILKAFQSAVPVRYVQKRYAQRSGYRHPPVHDLAAAQKETAAALDDSGNIGAVVRNDGLRALLARFNKRRQRIITGISLFAQFKLHGSPLLWHGLLYSMRAETTICPFSFLLYAEQHAQDAAQRLRRLPHNDLQGPLTSFAYSRSRRR